MASDNPVFYKSPNERIPYTFDWSDWLVELGQTIASRVTTVGPGLVRYGSDVTTSMTTTVTVEDGEYGREYPIVDRITTTPDGIIAERTILIRVRKR